MLPRLRNVSRSPRIIRFHSGRYPTSARRHRPDLENRAKARTLLEQRDRVATPPRQMAARDDAGWARHRPARTSLISGRHARRGGQPVHVT